MFLRSHCSESRLSIKEVIWRRMIGYHEYKSFTCTALLVLRHQRKTREQIQSNKKKGGGDIHRREENDQT